MIVTDIDGLSGVYMESICYNIIVQWLALSPYSLDHSLHVVPIPD